MVGNHDACDFIYEDHRNLALELANLEPGLSVLDIGTASGRLIAQAKQAVGTGVCIGVDAVKGLLEVDFPHSMRTSGLTIYPEGTAAQQVHRVEANVMDNTFVDHLQGLVGTPQTYDRIFAIRVFSDIPPDARLTFLDSLRRLLFPSGRIIMDMTARFLDIDKPPSEQQLDLPVLFRAASGYTEAPGCLVMQWFSGEPVDLADGGRWPNSKKIMKATQISPDRLWDVGSDQARKAAREAALELFFSRETGKDDLSGLSPGNRSSGFHELDTRKQEEMWSSLGDKEPVYVHQCYGRAYNMLISALHPALSPEQHDRELVSFLRKYAYRKQREIVDSQTGGLFAHWTLCHYTHWLEVMRVSNIVALRHRLQLVSLQENGEDEPMSSSKYDRSDGAFTPMVIIRL
ncbi:hypothetical protein OPT61_g1539 [Boeremia exigua]|uniref:Uncharacterized protein n=1 Tax=Boeremia exigua TaxID=749465 RepID=A0ACC2IQ04_9PLEO|nr:hypothetical protein OPT61_g1539 [Boeremia exigua]